VFKKHVDVALRDKV